MTLNLANYDDHPDWSERLQIIVTAIAAAEADVIAVQEVRFDPAQPTTQQSYQSMAEQLVYQLDQQPGYAGVSIVTQPLMFYPVASDHYPSPPPDGQLWEGVSILSRLPITETGALFLTRDGGDGNLRGTQYAAVTTSSSNTLYVFNTHFALDQTNRNSNATETLAYMNRSGGLQILLGDLNAIPSDPCITILGDGGLTDVWAKLEPDKAGYTYPSSKPSERIDYAWANAGTASLVTAIELVATQPVDGIYASDHVGIVVTLDL
jgi:endonuclease/exonuclease/phosphatase family metal-dependent hydrolase